MDKNTLQEKPKITKLPEYLENQIDLPILRLCNYLSPHFKRANMTPNDLTTFSLFFGLLAVYCLYHKIRYLPGVFYFISYIFDCADGLYARKYHMVTKFGDYYDHIKDATVFLLIIFILYKQQRIQGIIFIIVVSILSYSHLGCQEHYYKKHNPEKMHSDTLSVCKILCPFEHDIENALSISRYFGTGTSFLITSIYLFFLK
jgi:phosphatidylglycerophosphate synthase